ncbi:hypothetical protein LVD15_03950 [Fulvivirga maritima]|uniref:hypothetical protein n=1 Tax=Fulvivirga maritima TaxID=2904247 RepID=UPI001F37FB62|nr:hypothetical protein [Fulvivirga maritima]UII27589.1 hypothetical protein LVD15_03950 [Fulvivirga maritima]
MTEFIFLRHSQGLCFFTYRGVSLFLILIVWSSNVLAQNENILTSETILPSPQAVALVKDVAYPLGNYTGQPAVGVPLFSLSGKDISYPLSLLYHPHNHNMYSMSSLGYGWSLKGVGVITRVTNGGDDLKDGGYRVSNLPANNEISASLVESVQSGQLDVTPDLFYFSFLGHGGKFFIESEDKVVIDPNLHLKVQVPTDENSEWIIWDDAGYQYIFGSDDAVETTEDGLTTSWYLSEVISPQNENISFHYSSTTLTRLERINSFATGRFARGGYFPQYEIEDIASYSIPYLSSIELHNGLYARRINIGYYPDTPDEWPRLIKSISLSTAYKKEGSSYNGRDDDGTWPQEEFDWDVLAQCKFYYDGDEEVKLNYLEFFTSGYSDATSAIKIGYQAAANSQNILSDLEYSGGKKVKYTYEQHDISSFEKANILSQVDLGVRLSQVRISGQEENEIKYYYKDESGNSSAHLMLPEVNELSYNAQRWIKFGPFQMSSGSVTRENIVTLLQDILGGPIITYDWVSIESDKKGRTLYGYTNENQFVDANASGYYSGVFLPPLYGLSFLDGKLKQKNIYKRLSDNTWYPIERKIWQYEEVSSASLPAKSFLFVDAAENGSVGDAALAISSNGGSDIDYTDILGVQNIHVPTNWSRVAQSEVITSEDPGVSRAVFSDLEYSSNNYLHTEVTTLADGTKFRNILTYPSDYPNDPVLSEMCNRNMNSYPVERIYEKMPASAQAYFMLQGTVLEYGLFSSTMEEEEQILMKSSYVWEEPKGEAISEIPTISDKNYRLSGHFKYDQSGFLVESESRTGYKTATIWDLRKYLPIAQVENAGYEEVYYNGFEEEGSETLSKVGMRSHEGGQFTVPFTPLEGRDYMLSYWYYEGEEWKFREREFIADINEGSALDEVKVYPKGAMISSNAYDEKGNKIAESDLNGRQVYYEYDEKERLKYVSDSEGNIVQAYDHYKTQFADCDVNNSEPIEASFDDEDQLVMKVGRSHRFSVSAKGGCGELYYTWRVMVNGTVRSESNASKSNAINFTPNCADRSVEVRCIVTDKGKNYRSVIRLNAQVADPGYQMTATIVSGRGNFEYCTKGNDEILASADVNQYCGTLKYNWVYRYWESGSRKSQTSTKKVGRFTFMGQGELSCQVTSSDGQQVISNVIIGKRKSCL